MKLTTEVIVLNVSKYSVLDRETGVLNEGTTVRYLLSDNLSPVEEDNLKGFKLAKASFSGDIKKFDEFKTVPGVYSADLIFNIKADGSVTNKADNFVFKNALVAPLVADQKKDVAK